MTDYDHCPKCFANLEYADDDFHCERCSMKSCPTCMTKCKKCSDSLCCRCNLNSPGYYARTAVQICRVINVNMSFLGVSIQARHVSYQSFQTVIVKVV